MAVYKWSVLSMGMGMAMVPSEVASSSSILSTRDCALIQGFEDTTSKSFAEHFANMVHQREVCLDSRKTCQVPLQKRINDYHLFIEGQKDRFYSVGAGSAAKEAIAVLVAQFQATSGLRRRTEKPRGVSDYIFLVFVEPPLAEYNFDLYSKAHIIHDEFGFSPSEKKQRVELFKYFIDQKLPCITIFSEYPDNTIHDSHIWIRSDLNEMLMQQCVAEEFYNSFGLDEGKEVGNIFDYEFSHEAADTSLSAFDLLLLKILYSDKFPRGSNHSKTMTIFQQLFGEECTVE